MAETQKAPSGRVKRQPVGMRNRLSVAGKDPNYEYRFVNDVGDRVNQFMEAGYEFVEKSTHRVGDSRVDIASPEGTQAMVSVGVTPKGDSQKAYLMRIKKDWYKEDQKAKMEKVMELENQIKKPKIDGSYGKVEISEERV